MRTLHPSWEAHPASLRLSVVAASAAEPVRDAAVSVIDRLQYLPASTQIEALAASLVILATTIGQDPHDLVSRARRQVDDLRAFDGDVQALADYARGELT